MKTWHIVLVIVVLLTAFARVAAAQTPAANTPVPKYDVASEVTLKGTITDTSDRICPISGGMGFHFMLKTADDKTIEVHVASSKFIKNYDLVLKKDDQVEVVGSKVKMGDTDTILARQVTRGGETFVFRFKDGKPVW